MNATTACELCGGVFGVPVETHLAERHLNVMVDVTTDPRSGHSKIRLIEVDAADE